MGEIENERKVDAILREPFTKYDVGQVPDIENQANARLTHGNTGFLGEFTFLSVIMQSLVGCSPAEPTSVLLNDIKI